MDYDEAELFQGLAADHWAASSETDPRRDQDFFRNLVASQGGRGLELGCGTGRLLLPLLADGLDVTGCDLSGDMLDRCRATAAAQGLSPARSSRPAARPDGRWSSAQDARRDSRRG